MNDNTDRRNFLNRVGVLATASCLNQLTPAVFAAEEKEDNVSPVEDLMREHGLLNRLLLIYDHCSDSLNNRKAVDLKAVADARQIIKDFVETYHEKLEEEHLFPHFEKAQKLTDLVAVLRHQHEIGRQITEEIKAALDRKNHATLSSYLRIFTRMYRPHEAREDTVLFPAFQALVPAMQYKELGEQFEAREQELFGKEGFEGQVSHVGQIEKKLGIFDLAQFTPKVS